jgi:DNA-directed RNA polymerase subunit omega
MSDTKKDIDKQNMKELSIRDILLGKESRYSLAIAIAKRAREITSEAEQNGEVLLEKPVNIAIGEFKEDKYKIFAPKVAN